jgi:hypothetical protein
MDDGPHPELPAQAEEPDYAWDVFISYSRWSGWPGWVRKHFEPLFQHYLGEDLGRRPTVFVDWQSHGPGEWPAALGRQLARSRVLVPLLSRMYFESPWCKSEYELMRLRADQCGCPLIMPVIIHDGGGPDFDHAERQELVNLRRYANPAMPAESVTREALAVEIGKWTPLVASAISAVPPHDPSWEQIHVDSMNKTFDQVRQERLPSWGQ